MSYPLKLEIGRVNIPTSRGFDSATWRVISDAVRSWHHRSEGNAKFRCLKCCAVDSVLASEAVNVVVEVDSLSSCQPTVERISMRHDWCGPSEAIATSPSGVPPISYVDATYGKDMPGRLPAVIIGTKLSPFFFLDMHRRWLIPANVAMLETQGFFVAGRGLEAEPDRYVGPWAIERLPFRLRLHNAKGVLPLPILPRTPMSVIRRLRRDPTVEVFVADGLTARGAHGAALGLAIKEHRVATASIVVEPWLRKMPPLHSGVGRSWDSELIY